MIEIKDALKLDIGDFHTIYKHITTNKENNLKYNNELNTQKQVILDKLNEMTGIGWEFSGELITKNSFDNTLIINKENDYLRIEYIEYPPMIFGFGYCNTEEEINDSDIELSDSDIELEQDHSETLSVRQLMKNVYNGLLNEDDVYTYILENYHILSKKTKRTQFNETIKKEIFKNSKFDIDSIEMNKYYEIDLTHIPEIKTNQMFIKFEVQNNDIIFWINDNKEFSYFYDNKSVIFTLMNRIYNI